MHERDDSPSAWSAKRRRRLQRQAQRTAHMYRSHAALNPRPSMAQTIQDLQQRYCGGAFRSGQGERDALHDKQLACTASSAINTTWRLLLLRSVTGIHACSGFHLSRGLESRCAIADPSCSEPFCAFAAGAMHEGDGLLAPTPGLPGARSHCRLEGLMPPLAQVAGPARNQPRSAQTLNLQNQRMVQLAMKRRCSKSSRNKSDLALVREIMASQGACLQILPCHCHIPLVEVCH